MYIRPCDPCCTHCPLFGHSFSSPGPHRWLMEALETEVPFFVYGCSRSSMSCCFGGVSPCSILTPWTHAGTLARPLTHSQRHTGMLGYGLEHTSAQPSPFFRVGWAVPERHAFPQQENRRSSPGLQTGKIHPVFFCVYMKRVS